MERSPYPACTTSTKKFANSPSSTADSNGLGPGLSLSLTFPEILSCKVDFGTPCFLVACKIGVFSSVTSFIAASISLSVHCLRFLPQISVSTPGGADFVRVLPRLLLLFFGSKGWNGVQDLNDTVSGDAPTAVAMA